MALDETIQLLGEDLKRYTQEAIIQHGHVGTGRLLESVTIEVVELGDGREIYLGMEDYGWIVNAQSGFFNEALTRFETEMQQRLETALQQDLERHLILTFQ